MNADWEIAKIVEIEKQNLPLMNADNADRKSSLGPASISRLVSDHPITGSPDLFGFFQLELGFVFVEKGAEIVNLVQQAGPLFEVERNREASQAIDADAAFFADAEFQRSGALGGDLLLQFSKAGFHFFISRFCHVGPLGKVYNNQLYAVAILAHQEPASVRAHRRTSQSDGGGESEEGKVGMRALSN